MVPKLCQSMGARSLTTSLFLLSSSRAASLVSGEESSMIHWYILSLSTLDWLVEEVVVEEGAELVTGLLDILNSLYLLLSLVKKRHALL